MITLLATILAIIMVGCTNNKITDNTSYINPYKEIGEVHNKGLEFVCNKLQIMGEENLKFKKDELELICINKMKEFAENEIENYCELDYIHGLNIDYFINNVTTTTKDTFLDSVLSSSDLNPTQIEYLNRLIDLSNEFESILSELQDSLGIVNLEIINDIELCDDEKTLLLASTSVTESSFDYWDDNFYNWLSAICNLLGEDINSIENLDSISEEIWKEDIKGGIIGGITGGAASGGAGIIAGAVIGAFGLSAYEGLSIILNLF